jgi:cytochrome b involved in lipid metabolism
MKLFFLLLIGVVSCEEVAPLIPSNLEELNVGEPGTIPGEVLLDLDEEHFKSIMYDEDSLLAMAANAKPAKVAQGIALVKRMLKKNVLGDKAALTRILRLFQGLSGNNGNLFNNRWLAQRRPTKGKVIATGFNETKQWRLSFEIYQYGKVRNWGSIVHVTKGPNGSRLPGIWLAPYSSALHMCMWTHKTTNDCWNSPALAMKKYHKIVMMQKRHSNGKFYLTYWIDGTRKAYKLQNKPQAFRNLRVYSADPWYASPLAVIKNLRMVNL